MEWTKEAVAAALRTWWTNNGSPSRFVSGTEKMRDALDAAIKTQKIGQFVESQCDACTVREDARAEALEEAAKLLDGSNASYSFPILAAAIRNLK
jgi:hypothetical protein